MRARAQVNAHPIHPMLVAFPIGLFVTSFIFDLLGVGKIYLRIIQRDDLAQRGKRALRFPADLPAVAQQENFHASSSRRSR